MIHGDAHRLGLVGCAAIAVFFLCATGCGPAGRAGGGAGAGTGPAPPSFPKNFQPTPPLADPDPPPAGKPGLVYLARIHAQLGEPWRAFLEDCRLRLPPDNPLNDSSLALRVAMAIGRDGALQSVTVTAASGNPDFDQVAVELVRDATPFPAPPAELVSDDDTAHVDWLFARDRRQAGVATAELHVIEWEASRAVPRFLAAGNIAAAAARLLRAVEARSGAAGEGEALVELGQKLATAVIREALRQADVNVQRMAVAAVIAARLVAVAPELHAIIDSAVDLELRSEAIVALGAIGEKGAAPLLAELLAASKGNTASSVAAATALAAIGERERAEATLLGWLEAPDSESQLVALEVMTGFAVPGAATLLAALVSDAARPRPVRLAACTALGTSTTAATATASMKVLRAGIASSDAGLRAACLQGVAQAARTGVRSRVTYWSIVDLLRKERDDRGRAAAVLAAAYLEPGRFHDEIYVLGREKSDLVLVSLASALAVLDSGSVVAKLVRLTHAADPTVRRAAASALLQRKESAAHQALAALASDSDPEVRLVAVGALDDPKALADLLGDPSPQVRSAAFRSIVRTRGPLATLGDFVRAVAAAPPGSADRVLWARSWLVPDRRGAGTRGGPAR